MHTVKRRHYSTKPASGPEHAAWHLLSDEDLLAQRQRLLDRQRRFMEIAAAINASDDPDHVLRLVRDAIVDSGMFDRAGVWVHEGETFHGAWGTDSKGALRDEHGLIEKKEDWGPLVPQLLTGETPYVIKTWTPIAEDGIPDGQLVEHSIVALRSGRELVGLLSVDNLLSGHPILPEDVEQLLPFADMASAAIHAASMKRERDRLLQRQRHLLQISAGMNASLELPLVFRMLRDALVEAGGFDRAAVFLVDRAQGVVRGTWGTDRDGRPEDISYQVMGLEDYPERPMWRVANGEVPYTLVQDLTAHNGLEPGHSMFGVRAHAVIPMRTAGEIVGVICVDNLLSGRPISVGEIEGILPFSEQAALAVQNARLFQEVNSAQEALVRSEKLRALGELAGGVAHNINNLLTAVLGYAELIRRSPENTENVARYASIIERAGMDGAEIVRRVQQFAQQQAPSRFEVVDFSTVVGEAIEFSRPHWRDHAAAVGISIEMKSDLAPGLLVCAASSELREVVVNLIRNAVDAMPEGGRITVSCRRVATDAVLEVVDTGIGMDEATRKRVFEPFFTTKGPSLGLGMGLSVAWGIITRHSGAIHVDSRQGVGTKFRVSLPLAAAPEPPVRAEPAEGGLLWTTVLVVDDEPMVLESLCHILEHAGAVVKTAESAEAALAWLASNASACELVLSDHGMPGQSGLALLAAVREKYPDVRRALISGWGAAPPAEADLGPAEVVLSKPISRSELVGALVRLKDS